MIRLLLVADEPLMRQGFRLWLRQQLDVRLIGETASDAEALLLAPALLPDVVLIDFTVTPQQGIAATTILHALVPQSAVVFLSLYDDPATRAAAYAAGAAAFVGKQEGVMALLAAIHTAGEHRR